MVKKLLGTTLIIVLVILAYHSSKKTIKDENNIIYSDDADNIQSDEDMATELYVEKEYELYSRGLKYELLGYEIVEDVEIEKQSTFSAEYFSDGKIPDANKLYKYTDVNLIKELNPQLKDIWENGDSYSEEEFIEIYYANIDVIEKYTYMLHPKTRYIFVKVKITNTTGKPLYTDVDLRMYRPIKDSSLLQMKEICYFDGAVNTDDKTRKQFRCRNFVANEEIVCIIGYEINDTVGIEDYEFLDRYYVGVPTYEDYATVENTNAINLEEISKLE